MPAIVLAKFSGEQPHITPRLMPDNAAQIAQNVRLDDGSLTPINMSAVVTKPSGAPFWQSLIYHVDTWLGWNFHVNAVPGPVATDRLYYTGDGAPKMRVDGTVYPLAISRPTGALTATLGGTGTGDVTTRLYAYTFVTDFGEESEPCVLSNPVDWRSGNSVTLSGFSAAPGGRNITKQRIYRSQTGTSGTTLYFIAERAASAANYVDTINPDTFMEPCASIGFNSPPSNLAGLISMPNGMMAAFTGKKLYFCEPWQPHAWPEKYVLTTDYDIVALAAIGPSLIVLTTGYPYLCQGGMPESMQMVKIEQNFPCINARGVVDLGFAVGFPTHEGLALISANGVVTLPSANIFSRREWESYAPNSIVACQVSGRYAAFFNTIDETANVKRGMLLIDPTGGGFLTRTDIYSTAVWHSLTQSLLYYVDKRTGEIKIFDAPNAALADLTWKSKPFHVAQPLNFSAMKVWAKEIITQAEIDAVEALIAETLAHNADIMANGFTFGPFATVMFADAMFAADDMLTVPPPLTNHMNVSIYADGVNIFTVNDPNKIKRLPGGFLAHVWEIEVTTNFKIEQIAMATTVDELKQIP